MYLNKAIHYSFCLEKLLGYCPHQGVFIHQDTFKAAKVVLCIQIHNNSSLLYLAFVLEEVENQFVEDLNGCGLPNQTFGCS